MLPLHIHCIKKEGKILNKKSFQNPSVSRHFILSKPNFPYQKCQTSYSHWCLQIFKKHFTIEEESDSLGLQNHRQKKIKTTSSHNFHNLVFSRLQIEKKVNSLQRAGSMQISAAYGESRFFRLTSVLWAPTLHQSQCQGPFLCSSDIGQHFLQEKQTLHVTN